MPPPMSTGWVSPQGHWGLEARETEQGLGATLEAYVTSGSKQHGRS